MGGSVCLLGRGESGRFSELRVCVQLSVTQDGGEGAPGRGDRVNRGADASGEVFKIVS